MSNYDFIFDVLPSKDDERDFLVGAIYTTPVVLPATLDYRPELPSIRNQGPQGSCSTQTASAMKEWQELQDVNFNKHMSPQFIYNQRANEGYGMTPRDTMQIMQKIGCVPEADYPYGSIYEISKELKEIAEKYKILGYAKIHTLEDLKKSLVANGPCYIAFPVYSFDLEFWLDDPLTDTYYGGHAVTVVGYTKDSFIIRNSWGDDWGDNGYTYYKFKDWGVHWEAWTTLDADSNPVPPEPIELEPDVPEPSPIDPEPALEPNKKKDLEDDLRKKSNNRLKWWQKIFFCFNKKI